MNKSLGIFPYTLVMLKKITGHSILTAIFFLSFLGLRPAITMAAPAKEKAIQASFKTEDKNNNGNSRFIPEKFQANFEQMFVSSLSGREKKSNGVIKYLYPGHLWLEVQQPEKERTLFISNAEKSWYYTPPFDAREPGEVVVSPASKMLLSSFLDTLKNGPVSNSRYTAMKKGDIYHLEFSKKTSAEIGVKKADLLFVSGKSSTIEDMKSMVIWYNDQRKVTLSFSEFKRDVSLKSEDFVFKMDKKIKVVEQK